MPQLLMATHNHTKYLIFSPVFEQHGFEVLTLHDIPNGSQRHPEAGQTAAENALAKARRYHSPTHPWVFGDDSGLEIDALDGEPGLMARRWNGHFPDEVDDQTWLDYLLERMEGIPPERRTAAFVAAWVLFAPDGKAHVHHVRTPFQIATAPIRPISPGSPIAAVRLDTTDHIRDRREELRQRWAEWGILERLLPRFDPL